jgi:predicted TIM-barrel fold metal-dependent hydrolase
MRIDVNAFLGAYPHRRVPGTTPEALVGAMERTKIDQAWVSHLPSVFSDDPSSGNAWLYDVASRDRRLRPVPAIHPGRSDWQTRLEEAADRRVPAVRCDPGYYRLDPAGAEVRKLASACGAAGLPLLVAVRLEDARQRRPDDGAPELSGAALRALLRGDDNLRLIVTHAERALIEEVHFGSTPDEAARVWWDISWIWGPWEEHLATLLETIGAERFVFGTGQPLRLPEASVAKLDLLDVPADVRARVESENVVRGIGT